MAYLENEEEVPEEETPEPVLSGWILSLVFQYANVNDYRQEPHYFAGYQQNSEISLAVFYIMFGFGLVPGQYYDEFEY